MKVNMSLACWPGFTHEQAAQHLVAPPVEPCFGQLTAVHTQIVPQCLGILDETLAAYLCLRYPQTQFRLHANVRVLPERHVFADLSNFADQKDWFKAAARISRMLGATVYTAHAGARKNASLREMFYNAQCCADLFRCPVGVEGHYPTQDNAWLLSSWEELRELYESRVPYVLDMSHLRILAHKTGRVQTALIADMISCDRCLEVHVSDNDGRFDQHAVCEEPPWWFSLLDRAHKSAVMFSEGNHRHYGRNLSGTDPH
ncbi:MAG: hypothetical protein FWD67_11980 [Betaproteobacteria bacterium]|nr:hypothetical protein [Betaproteobacteria bacterium]